MNRTKMRVERKRQKRKRWGKWVGITILLFLLAGTAYGLSLYQQVKSTIDRQNEALDFSEEERENRARERASRINPENTSILFIGVDGGENRGTSNTRSDALMVATFNEKEKSIKLLSIPRDSLVDIPGHYRTKINSAYNPATFPNGGRELTVRTVEELLHIPIDDYVEMNFDAFVDIVNAFDGVEIDVPFAMSEQNSLDEANAIQLQPGLQELNGEEALAFARSRKMDNDIERGKRQQELIVALIDKALSFGSITKYNEAIDAVGNNMTTSMPSDELSSYFSYALRGTSLDIERMTLKGTDSWEGGYYWILDETYLAEVQTKLRNHLGVTADPD